MKEHARILQWESIKGLQREVSVADAHGVESDGRDSDEVVAQGVVVEHDEAEDSERRAAETQLEALVH